MKNQISHWFVWQGRCVMQRLDLFKLPPGFRGRSAFWCQLWWVVQSCLFSTSPQFMYAWRVFLLRIFGAKIGKKVIIRPTVRVTYPWKLMIGDNSWVGDNVELYNLGDIVIGKNSVISQRSYLCTGSHDETKIDFAIYQRPIVIKDSVWVAADVFISPGVIVNENSVIGARSSVFHDVKSGYIYMGTPARPIKVREAGGN
ncbi:WcaF family extracellular polysaccharide biosynthesis acetyltransferase [Halomonas sp. M4R1S46]|uniref:WcaF family extracellular polysaccharide biosynthesis acetyltransferase n=1 Tax=Halomonas sp. M4R1S46 TaxID=2982692 RepID=UPI002964ECC2|nr:WcaF family extracellular polysaccharide biosynthesis acetyltransferase [Halomonas sp. M4R1S46]